MSHLSKNVEVQDFEVQDFDTNDVEMEDVGETSDRNRSREPRDGRVDRHYMNIADGEGSMDWAPNPDGQATEGCSEEDIHHASSQLAAPETADGESSMDWAANPDGQATEGCNEGGIRQASQLAASELNGERLPTTQGTVTWMFSFQRNEGVLRVLSILGIRDFHGDQVHPRLDANNSDGLSDESILDDDGDVEMGQS
jgi:hypothetical protein